MDGKIRKDKVGGSSPSWGTTSCHKSMCYLVGVHGVDWLDCSCIVDL